MLDAANSPLAFTDPLGLWPSWEDVEGVASGVGDWVVENRHTIIDVATTVGTVVAIGAVCGATSGARWLLHDAAGWRCHGGLGVG